MSNNPRLRAVWLAIVMLTSLIVGAAGGLLSWIGGANPATAILAGAGVFSGAVIFLLSVLRFAFEGDQGLERPRRPDSVRQEP